MMLLAINGGKMPTKGTVKSAGVDVYANETIIIKPNKVELVPLGIVLTDELSQRIGEFFIGLYIRSSLAMKGLGLANSVGIIDADYKSCEIKMMLRNYNDEPYTVKRGDKIGQLILHKHHGHIFNIISTDVREAGFGSTGE